MMQASRRTWRIGQVNDVEVHFTVYRDTMEHRAAILLGQKLAAAQLLYGDSVEGALVEQANSGRGFLADLARSVIENAKVVDLNQIFRDVSLGGSKVSRNDERIGALRPGLTADGLQIAEGSDDSLSESPPLTLPSNTRQMTLF